MVGIMEQNNFRSFMEFLRFLEAEDMKGSVTAEAMATLAISVGRVLTEEQRATVAKEFPGLLKKTG